MRKLLLLALFAFSSSAFAQQKNAFSIFVTDWQFSRDTRGSHANAGAGIAFDRMLTPRFSAELAIASERHHTYPYIVNTNGLFQEVTPRAFRIYPVDLAVRYHFLNETRWKPFIGVAAHYVGAPHVGSEFRYQNHFGPEIVGGTVVQLGRSFGLVLDGKIYIGDREHYVYPFKPSFGLLWRF